MPTDIDRHGVKRLMSGGTPVIEVLESSQYRLAHLPGAVSIPAWELTADSVAAFDKQQAVIVYCFDTA